MAQLSDIRAGAARLCDDWVEFVATADSSDTSTFTDENAGYENDSHYRGSELWFVSGDNAGQTVRVADSDLDTATLTLRPGLSSPVSEGDVAWAFNIGGMGTRLRTYDAAINDAITGLGPTAWPVYFETLPAVWDRAIAWVDVPATFKAITGGQYFSYDSNWYDIPVSSIAFDVVTKQFAISPEIADLAHGYNLRLRGRKAHPTLVLDTDTTDVDYEWLTNEVAAGLLLLRRDQLKVNLGGARKNQADALRGKAGPFNLIPDMIRVR